MKHFSILLLILFGTFALTAHADDVLWSCHGEDKGIYRVSTMAKSTTLVTVTRTIKGAEDVKQTGTYQIGGQLDSMFIQVTNGDFAVLLAGYEPHLGAMSGYVQIAPEQPKVAVRCPLNN